MLVSIICSNICTRFSLQNVAPASVASATVQVTGLVLCVAVVEMLHKKRGKVDLKNTINPKV